MGAGPDSDAGADECAFSCDRCSELGADVVCVPMARNIDVGADGYADDGVSDQGAHREAKLCADSGPHRTIKRSFRCTDGGPQHWDTDCLDCTPHDRAFLVSTVRGTDFGPHEAPHN